MVVEAILSELNKRLADRNKELEEKNKIYDARLNDLKQIEESTKKQEELSIELEKKLDILIEKEKELLDKNIIIKTEENSYEVIRKEDITYIEDDSKITKEVIDVLN